MVDLFKKRKLKFIKQINGYLPYVFNDHFVLVLLFLLGFLLFQYSELLKHFPDDPFLVILGLVATVLVLLKIGSIGLYLEAADKQFLLVKEEEIKGIIKSAIKSSFMVWGGLQTLILIFLAPLFLKIGFDVISFPIFLVVLLAVKWFIMVSKTNYFMIDNQLAWDKAIEYEIKRKQSVLKFFSLFTTVKGISTTVKRRAYMDACLRFFSKTHSKLWSNLYIRAFLRSSDYFMLSMRLLVLSVLAIVFVKNFPIGIGLALVFNYLLVFQLLALLTHFDYQYVTQLYPTDKTLKKQNLKSVLRLIMGIVVLCEIVIGCLVDFRYLGLVLFALVMELYLPYKLNKMID